MKLFTHDRFICLGHFTSLGLASIAAVLLITLAGTEAFATTSAYWRHEEGTDDNVVVQGPNSVLDSSGFDNHMQTFGPETAATYTTEVSPLALRSGLPNNLSLDFGPAPVSGTEDGGGRNDDNYTTQEKLVNTELFTAMTVEIAFNMHSVNGWQALFGKDGKPLGDEVGEDDSPVPPFKVLIRNDDFPDAIPNQLFIEWIDGDGVVNQNVHFLASGETIVPDQWYHIAFTLTDSAAELWMAGETGDYVLKDAISGEDFAGPSGEVIVFDTTPFTIGRGMFNNGVTDWSDALIDEVRVSNTALTPTEFLFVTEPGGQAGDFDDDGDVDGRDFLVWQRGESPTPLSAGDLADWQTNYGAGGLGAFAAVPEPATWAVFLGLIGVGASLRSHKTR
jgi:hypothetical protein